MVLTSGILLLLSALGSTQEARGNANKPPALPVIDFKACPFEGCVFREWIARKDSRLYSTWRGRRRLVGRVRRGEQVTGLTGVHITWKPDRIEVMANPPDPGYVILAYQYHGEGYFDVWIKGEGMSQVSLAFVEGLGCEENCTGKVVGKGWKEWWVKVKTSHGRTGWVKVAENFDCMDSLGGPKICGAIQKPTH